MKAYVLPALAALWGGAILINAVVSPPSGSGSYAAGGMLGVLFGVALLAGGGWTLVRRAQARG